MPNEKPLIPEVTDDDIEWVCALMGLDPFDAPRREYLKCRTTVDLSACPGSGKTTLIVAKLAILARKWPHQTRGICVLSHTNVAREQIEHRLGRTVVGQRLLSYPHFIDTIHGFVNRFLALPWLNSSGYPVEVIDDEIALRRRWFKLQHATRSGLERNRYDQGLLRISDSDFSLGDIRWGRGSLGRSSTTYQALVASCKESIEEGFHCYDEMFVWADALLKNHEQVPVWLTHRFPLIVLDEMQDTFERQATFLSTVFPRTSDSIVVQRVGDPNQAIFDAPEADSAETDPFPDPDKCIGIPNSYRFGNEIAALASPFAVYPVGTHGLTGIGPKGLGMPDHQAGHAVFVFPDDSTDGVLDAYGKHALSVLGPELADRGLVTAVGHIHQDDPEVSPGHGHYPKSVGHYWDGYAVEISRKDPNPRTLAQYMRVAQSLTADGNVLSPGVEKIASGILRLARRIGDIGDLKRKSRTHRAIIEKLENSPKVRATYRNIVRLLLSDREVLFKAGWPALSERVMTVAVALCDGDIDKSKGERFLDWPKDDPSVELPAESPTGNFTPNVYRVLVDDGSINIRLGSIHSVKRQTHLATLLLNTYWHDHSARRMLPWLIGTSANENGAGARDVQRLLHTYVAMTRPSHLLCLAVPRSALGEDQACYQNITILKNKGWRVAEIIDGVAQWQD